jgi:hypothetical protein
MMLMLMMLMMLMMMMMMMMMMVMTEARGWQGERVMGHARWLRGHRDTRDRPKWSKATWRE